MTRLNLRIFDLLSSLQLGSPDHQALVYATNCLNGATPSHEVSTFKIRNNASSREFKHYEGAEEVMMEIIAELNTIGYQDSSLYLTPQEFACVGGSGLWDEIKVDPQNAYRPAALIMGELSLTEVLRARELARVSKFGYPPDILFDGISEEEGEILFTTSYFSLELLNEKGRTKSDPRILDLRFQQIPGLTHKADFPYRRP